MGPREAAAELLRAHAGRHLCVRYVTLTDGSIAFCELGVVPVGRLRAARTALAAAMLAACGPHEAGPSGCAVGDEAPSGDVAAPCDPPLQGPPPPRRAPRRVPGGEFGGVAGGSPTMGITVAPPTLVGAVRAHNRRRRSREGRSSSARTTWAKGNGAGARVFCELEIDGAEYLPFAEDFYACSLSPAPDPSAATLAVQSGPDQGLYLMRLLADGPALEKLSARAVFDGHWTADAATGRRKRSSTRATAPECLRAGPGPGPAPSTMSRGERTIRPRESGRRWGRHENRRASEPSAETHPGLTSLAEAPVSEDSSEASDDGDNEDEESCKGEDLTANPGPGKESPIHTAVTAQSAGMQRKRKRKRRRRGGPDAAR